MEKGIHYALLFGIPGFVISILVGMFVRSHIGTWFWFLVGDNSTPPWAETTMTAIVNMTSLIIFFVIVGIGFLIGKAQEAKKDSE